MATGSAVPVPASHLESARDAEAATTAANAAMAAKLPFSDVRDFEAVHRGLIAPVPDGAVVTSSGTALWNLGEYAFINGELAPATVNPSLWRMARLNMANGLFKVKERLYQLRGFDISNMTVIEGDSGLILIDPLTTAEVARAALDLYYAHRPRRPVVAVIYTHSHLDHYGGVRGVVDEADVQAGKVAVVAPAGFMEAISGENVLAGLPMMRRAQFQFGHLLPRGTKGQVDAGLGKGVARGTPGLIAPTLSIAKPIEQHTIDGVKIVFQLAPETEAPAEMHMFYPDLGVLNMAENACPVLHNFIPLRGAVARDPRVWSKYIGDALKMYVPQADVMIGQHHWPTWGRDAIVDYLEAQRDLYKHIHDQTLRYMNKGWRPAEIAEAIDLPPGLADRWSVRGYYGTVSHNVKAVYQRYLSWYDGNPCNLHPLPPAPAAKKFVEYMGGAPAVIARARADFARGEFRWVAQVMKEVIFAEPDNKDARALCADALEQMGYQAESATWRNAFLRRAGIAPRRFPGAGAVARHRRHARRIEHRRVLRRAGDPPRSREGCGAVLHAQLAFYRPRRGDGPHAQELHVEPPHGRTLGKRRRPGDDDPCHARCAGPAQDDGARSADVRCAQDRGRSVEVCPAVRHARPAGNADVRHSHPG